MCGLLLTVIIAIHNFLMKQFNHASVNTKPRIIGNGKLHGLDSKTLSPKMHPTKQQTFRFKGIKHPNNK